MACRFSGWSVDCEYNRHLKQEKRLRSIREFVKAKRKSAELRQKEENFGICVSPDVVAHKRGNDNANLLVLEMKKGGHPFSEQEYDFLKLRGYVDEVG